MTGLEKDLAGLSSAEEFFAYFGLDYDPRTLASSRLHILKRFHDNLAEIESLETMNRDEQHTVYREQLRLAHDAFVAGPALTQRVFPRLERIRGAFVPLSSVKR